MAVRLFTRREKVGIISSQLKTPHVVETTKMKFDNNEEEVSLIVIDNINCPAIGDLDARAMVSSPIFGGIIVDHKSNKTKFLFRSYVG